MSFADDDPAQQASESEMKTSSSGLRAPIPDALFYSIVAGVVGVAVVGIAVYAHMLSQLLAQQEVATEAQREVLALRSDLHKTTEALAEAQQRIERFENPRAESIEALNIDRSLPIQEKEQQCSEFGGRWIASRSLCQGEGGCDGEWKFGVCVDPPFRLIAPQAGDTLCLGEEVRIEWEGPDDIDYVKVGMRKAGDVPINSYTIGSFPAELGYTYWRVGEVQSRYPGTLYEPGTMVLDPGLAYEFSVSTMYEREDYRFPIGDEVDGTVRVIDCRG